MKILNLYFTATGNTTKVAEKIDATLLESGHEVETMKVTANLEVDVLAFDYVFLGSGVYEWLPGQPVINFVKNLRRRYADDGEIKPSSPKLPGKKAVIYCTYGGAHTGINEAIPATKYMGQIFEHLGFEIAAEWHFIGEYHGRFQPMSTGGRLGDIRGRPNEADLHEVAEKVREVVQS
jgi:flavodoxin